MFRPANPSSRRPAWLQNGTKENVIWQLKLAVLYIAGISLKDWYEERKLKNKYKTL